ncbi:MAG: GNAT family N-acetyltransferase [Proteobacteria bacterium]|nr:GNAT family N-acetyltransferase [Pseudomonadota bacterium]
MPEIRPLRREDRDALYAICLKTGDAGQDATALYRDPELLGHLYAGPYVALEPESGFVLEDEDGIGGYIVGARDTYAFETRLEQEWWPPLRLRYPDPDALLEPERHLARSLHKPWHTPKRITEPYPSHLHINLLPRFQGRWGRRMMDRWLAAMRDAGSPGAHLGVGTRNERAVRFYLRYGFTEFQRWNDVLMLGIGLK